MLRKCVFTSHVNCSPHRAWQLNSERIFDDAQNVRLISNRCFLQSRKNRESRDVCTASDASRWGIPSDFQPSDRAVVMRKVYRAVTLIVECWEAIPTVVWSGTRAGGERRKRDYLLHRGLVKMLGGEGFGHYWSELQVPRGCCHSRSAVVIEPQCGMESQCARYCVNGGRGAHCGRLVTVHCSGLTGLHYTRLICYLVYLPICNARVAIAAKSALY